MVPTENDSYRDGNHEIYEINETETSQETNQTILVDYIPTIQKEIMTQNPHEKRFLDFLKSHPSTGSSSPNRHFHVPFIRKINWGSLLEKFKKWIKNPSNIAIFIWIIFVAIGLFIWFLLVIGILNNAIPSSSVRSKWTEVVNQILNALFTIMCLYQNPRLFHHLVLVLRWTDKDRAALMKIYTKGENISNHQNKRWHILFVIFLLNLTCFSQYFCCGLFWAYSKDNRPNWALNLGYGVGIISPIIAGLYVSHGPLAKKPEEVFDSENQISPNPIEPELDRNTKKTIVTRPEWIGGLFDIYDDLTVFFLSTICTFCVFGWNLERLGFGNMYVHIFTFMLLCIAPFFIFNITALNIYDDTIKYIVGILGIILCFFGLLYGGFWRIQMRKRFKLPGKSFCGARESVADCVQWLFCCPCSLAQEVRMGNFYDIEDDIFFKKVADVEGKVVFVPVRSYSCPAKIGTGTDLSRICFERVAKCPPIRILIEN